MHAHFYYLLLNPVMACWDLWMFDEWNDYLKADFVPCSPGFPNSICPSGAGSHMAWATEDCGISVDVTSVHSTSVCFAARNVCSMESSKEWWTHK